MGRADSSERSFKPRHDVEPWLLDVAQALVRVVKDADHMGVATFEHASVAVEVSRDRISGIRTAFWTVEKVV